jgi:hypothetical protein
VKKSLNEHKHPAQRRKGAEAKRKTKKLLFLNLCVSASPISGVRGTPSESTNRTLREMGRPSVQNASNLISKQQATPRRHFCG